MKLSNKQHKDKEIIDWKYEEKIIRYEQQHKVYLEVIDNQNKRITNLEQQIIEKLKEIDELKRVLQLEWACIPVRCDGKTFTKLNIIKDFKNSIRKQVCDEIRGYFAKNTFKFEGTEMLLIAEINLTDFMNFLKKIEQGEEK